jgi:hypothetical protein
MNHDGDFQRPPTIWVIVSFVGGIATGIGLIIGLESLSDRLSLNQAVSTTGDTAIVSMTSPKSLIN